MEKEHVVLEGTLQEITDKLSAQHTADPVVETVVEAAAEESAPETVVTATEGFDKYGFLNETFSTDFKTDDDINAWKSTITEKTSKFDELQKQYEQAQTELKAVNPRKFFASDDDFIVNQLKIKYPDLNPNVISKALTTDLAKLDPIQAITYKELLNDPKGEVYENEKQAYDHVCRKLGYDPEVSFDEQEEGVKVAIRAEAKAARAEFTKLKSEVEIPEIIDLTAKKAEQESQAKASYDKFKPLVERDLQSVSAGLDKIDITVKAKDGKNQVLFSYDLGDFKNSKLVKDTVNEVLEFTARNAREWTPEIAKKATEAIVADLRNQYIAANIGQIIEAHRDQVTKDLMDKKFEKENNSRPLNPELNNPSMTEEQKKLKSVKDKFKQDAGLTGKKTYAP